MTSVEIVAFLNSLAEIDPIAMRKLVESRVECNQAMVDHPTVQVARSEDESFFEVGLIGILNGIVGIEDDSKLISAIISDDPLFPPVKFQITDSEIATT